MSKRIGIIQTRGIGDIIIALPIADFYLEQDYEVLWAIDENFVPMFQAIKPSINFLPVTKGPGYFFHDPYKILQEKKCEKILILYSYLSDLLIYDTRLSSSLKFDEYKYAVSGVPFARKWTLEYERDLKREENLFKSLNIKGEYLCFHNQGSNMSAPVEIAPERTQGYQMIRIEPITDNPFDWLLTLERAKKLVLLDSCFANLVEQLNLPNEKYLILRSSVQFTPVYKNGWRFIFPSAQTL